MGDNILQVLKQYDMEVEDISRGRGVYICNTNKGLKLLMECKVSEIRLKTEYDITSGLRSNGLILCDTINTTKEGALYALDEDEKRYIIKDWYQGRSCILTDETNVLLGAKTLGLLHCELMRLGEELDLQNDGMPDFYERNLKRYKELKKVKNYLQAKKNKNEFELCAFSQCGKFYAQAGESIDGMEVLKNEYEHNIIHGNYNYHNLIIVGEEVVVTGFEKFSYDIQILDLYDYMRKALEKNEWNIYLGQKIIEEYEKYNPIKDIEFKILHLAFLFPEKFWKLLNCYYNGNKVLVSRKNYEKLEKYVEQETARKIFLDTIFA